MKPSTSRFFTHGSLANTCSSNPLSSNRWFLQQRRQNISFSQSRTAPLCFPLPPATVGVPKVSRMDSLSYKNNDMNLKISVNRRIEQPKELSAPTHIVEDETNRILSILADFIDSLWIFKVFKPFGLTLPPIILAFILYGGLKAFLVAFTVCLGLSVGVVAIEALWRACGFGAFPKLSIAKQEAVENKLIVGEMRTLAINGAISNQKVNKSEYGGWGGQSILKPKHLKPKVDDLSVNTLSLMSFDIFRQGGKVLVFLCLLMTVSPFMNFLI